MNTFESCDHVVSICLAKVPAAPEGGSGAGGREGSGVV